MLNFERAVSDSELGENRRSPTWHGRRRGEILDFGFWILDFGFWILDFGLAESFGLCTLLPLAIRTYSPASWRALEINSSESQ